MFLFFKKTTISSNKSHEISLYKIAKIEINKFYMRDMKHGFSPVFPPSDFKQ